MVSLFSDFPAFSCWIALLYRYEPCLLDSLTDEYRAPEDTLSIVTDFRIFTPGVLEFPSRWIWLGRTGWIGGGRGIENEAGPLGPEIATLCTAGQTNPLPVHGWRPLASRYL